MFSKSLIYLAVSFCFIISFPAFPSEPKYVPSEILIRFTPKTDGKSLDVEEANSIVASVCDGRVKYMSSFVPGLTLVKLADDVSVEDAVSRFKNLPGIINAQPNFIYRTQSRFPNDTRFNELWGMHNMGQTRGVPDADIDAPEAWDIATGTTG
jgi:hypothetical protein